MSYGLEWLPQGVQNTLAVNGIETAAQLSRAIKVSNSVVYDAFDKDWKGRATPTLIDAMCQTFGVPMHQLVVEPMTKVKRRPTITSGRKRRATA